MFTNANPAAVCLLVINRIDHLPKIAVSSILEKSSCHIFIGYLNLEDIRDFCDNPRVSLIDLNLAAKALGIDIHTIGYQDYLKSDFFKLIQLKWSLLTEASKRTNCKYLILNDFDVIWVKDASSFVPSAFEIYHDTQVLIQDNSSNPAQPSLCMGFVVFKLNDNSTVLFNNLANRHAEMYSRDKSIGDDGVISDYFINGNGYKEIRLLPQSVFPTGNLVSLYSRKFLFPGLAAPTPYIFHANYVIGLKKKLLLLFALRRALGIEQTQFSRNTIALFGGELFLRRLANSSIGKSARILRNRYL
jgi:hypothetical protein